MTLSKAFFKRLAAAAAGLIIAGSTGSMALAQTNTTAAPPAATAAPTATATAPAAPTAAETAAFDAKVKAAQDRIAKAADWAPNSGDTAWMLTSTALVLLMTIPGLALFYGGMVRKKNVIATVAQSFAVTAIVTVVWYVIEYSFAFGTNPDANMNKYFGGFGQLMLKGMGPVITNKPYTIAGSANTIPEYVFMMFQMTFAIITPALICGAYAERFKFSALVLFNVLWSIFVYGPIAHWVWGGGFLGAGGVFGANGVLDFAGGTVVHINAGVAGLVCALVLGKRIGYGKDNMAPNNLVYTMIGASLLWVGWFGFNAGSALTSGAQAGAAMAATQIATAAAVIAWAAVEWIVSKRPTMLGMASGAVAGLVAITPASGFVNPTGALIIGLAAGAGCYGSAVWLKRLFKYDDSLDAFGVHGVGGLIGALLTGVFADASINTLSKSGVAQVIIQAEGCLATILWSGVMTFVILMVCKFTTGLRVSEDAETEGLDMALHGEALHEH
jgi:Amt family ammonium transporter